MAPADDCIAAAPQIQAAGDKLLPLPAGEAPGMSVVSEPRAEAEASSTVDGDGDSPGDDTIIQAQAPLLALSGSAVAVLAAARELDSAPYPPPVRRVRSQTLKASQVCTAPPRPRQQCGCCTARGLYVHVYATVSMERTLLWYIRGHSELAFPHCNSCLVHVLVHRFGVCSKCFPSRPSSTARATTPISV
jgi:hypothetical protein